MRKIVLGASIALLLASCGKEAAAPAASASGEPAAGAARRAVSASASVAVPVTARKVGEENDLYVFDYGYPAAAGAIPALKAWLDADIDKQRAELAKDAREGKRAADEGGFPFRPYSRSLDWQVVTDLPGWLSLSTIVGTDSGGAHPNYVFDALLWDRVAGRRVAVEELFISKKALSDAIRAPFCDAIDAQRAKKRGGKIDRHSGDPFDECLDPVELTVILGSSNRKAFDRIGILAAPYAAGPYVEGDYEVTLPVTSAVMAAVKPRYRPVFVAGR